MILEGNTRAFGAELAAHLLNPRDNDHVTVHGLDGFIADDLFGAFAEIEAISQATQCQKYLFSLSLNPPLEASVSVEIFEAVIDRAARVLGLSGQPRAVVFHEKLGRRHAHVVWSRIDAAKMKAIDLPHFKRKLFAVSRDLYLEQGWEMPEGFKDRRKRDPNRFTNAEAGQAKRAGRSPAELKAMFRALWETSDSQAAFAAALSEKGFVLARGDRRGIVAVDPSGKVWSLSRWCGVKAGELRGRIAEPELLPDVTEAARLARGMGGIDVPERGKAYKRFEEALAQMVARQRQERADLLARQREAEAARLRQTPKALRVAFLKITGRHRAFVESCAQETAQANASAQADRQRLIERHLAERRAFERAHAPSRGAAHLPQGDTRQRLELQDAPTELSAAVLRAQPALILDELSKTKAAFTRTDTLRALSRFFDAPASLRAQADAALSSPRAVRLPSDRTRFYTTRDFQAAEAKLGAAAAQLRARKTSGIAEPHAQAALSAKNAQMRRTFGSGLSDEQTRAIRHVLGKECLAHVVGLAGAGKSTMLSVAADAWRRQCVEVHGAALAGKAADSLQDASGIPSRTLASLEKSWKTGHAPIKSGDVLVIDEAGMVGTRQMARVAAKMSEIGAKLVLVGDPDQLQPIEAGMPFRDLVAKHGAARLTEVRRQRQDWQHDATRELARGETSQAVEAYRRAGAVKEHGRQDEAIEALAEQYAMDALASDTRHSRLALAHKRADVHALNQSIRAALRDQATQEADVLLQTEAGKRAFGPGDRLVFTGNDPELGVKNGMLGTVRKAARGKVVVELDGEDRQKVTFNPRDYQTFDHGYAVTIHKSQGVTVDRAYVLGSRSMDRHLTYVALTRHRDAVQLFTSLEDRPAWTQNREHQQKRPRTRDGPSLG